MRLRISHSTTYTFDPPVTGLIQMMRLTPSNHDGQYVASWRIDTSVDGRLTEREDGFGNVVHWFTPDEPADALTIRVAGDRFRPHVYSRGRHTVRYGRDRPDGPVLRGLTGSPG